MIAELTKMLQSAAKGKAPIVAIPIEGHAPVCLNRKRLAVWLKGVTVTKVELITPPDLWYFVQERRKVGCFLDETKHLIYADYEGPLDVSCDREIYERSIKIEGRAGNVKTTCRMFAIQRNTAALEIQKWADAERAKNKKIIGQGAISTVALKEAKKAAKAKERAAKLLQMEKGGCDELDDAKNEIINIFAAARRHGRGPEKGVPYQWEQREADDKKAETIIRHVAHHNVSHRVRKACAVIQWRMKALRGEWYAVTKFNPGRRKTTANKFFKVKKSIRIIQIVKDYNELTAKLMSILPESIPNPRWPDEDHRVFWICPLHRPNRKKPTDPYDWDQHYHRDVLAKRLRAARETIRVLTPPPDEMEVAA